MDVNRLKTATELLSTSEHLLKNDEVRYGLIAGILARLVINPHFYGDIDPCFYTVTDTDSVCGIAIITPPHNIILAHFCGEPTVSAQLLATSISRFSSDSPGVIGESYFVNPFVEQWCRERRVKIRSQMLEKLYRLDTIRDVPSVTGKCRLAEESDIHLIDSWLRKFQIEVFNGDANNNHARNINERIKQREIFIWEDNVPVCLVCKSWGTTRGRSVGPVYTPPEFRRRGYATACMRAACQQILNSGYDYCMLYADQANPISNSIYKKIGFVEVSDAVMYGFSKEDR